MSEYPHDNECQKVELDENGEIKINRIPPKNIRRGTLTFKETPDELAALRARIAELEAATPTLELVGGEWEERGSWCEVRFIGPYQQGLINPGDSGQWRWDNSSVKTGPLSHGWAPTREAAIEAAEQALLEEVKKFVRIK